MPENYERGKKAMQSEYGAKRGALIAEKRWNHLNKGTGNTVGAGREPTGGSWAKKSKPKSKGKK
jgi:hypothetical protein